MSKTKAFNLLSFLLSFNHFSKTRAVVICPISLCTTKHEKRLHHFFKAGLLIKPFVSWGQQLHRSKVETKLYLLLLFFVCFSFSLYQSCLLETVDTLLGVLFLLTGLCLPISKGFLLGHGIERLQGGLELFSLVKLNSKLFFFCCFSSPVAAPLQM